jgi:hypothetical protein
LIASLSVFDGVERRCKPKASHRLRHAGWLAGLCLLASPAIALDVIVSKGRDCPARTTRVTYAEALANQSALCAMLGTWFIARLAEGGSIDGPGYKCRMRPHDPRVLGHSLCKAVTPSPCAATLSGCEAGV